MPDPDNPWTVNIKTTPVETIRTEPYNPWKKDYLTISNSKTSYLESPSAYSTTGYDYSSGNHGDPDNHDACDDWA